MGTMIPRRLARLILLLPILLLTDLLAPAWLAAAPTGLPEGAPAEASLQGQLLIAAPTIGDPRFAHTVILMVRHDRSGALGLIINRPFEERTIASLLAAIGRQDDTVEGRLRVYAGGPVQLGAGFILHSADYHGADTMDIDGHIAMSSDPEILRDIGHHKGPEKFLFAIGYAGWAPGQLEQELARKDWFTAPADAKFVFDEDRELLWEHALARRTRDL
jgi:putative transcriptional regulator